MREATPGSTTGTQHREANSGKQHGKATQESKTILGVEMYFQNIKKGNHVRANLLGISFFADKQSTIFESRQVQTFASFWIFQNIKKGYQFWGNLLGISFFAAKQSTFFLKPSYTDFCFILGFGPILVSFWDYRDIFLKRATQRRAEREGRG